MLCKNCGFEALDTANFCSNCGSAIVKMPEPSQNCAYNNTVPIAQQAMVQEAAPTISSSPVQPEVTDMPPTSCPTPPQAAVPAAQFQPAAAQVQVQQPPKHKDNSGFATAALVLGIVGVFPVYALNFIPAVLALIFGIISRKSSKSSMAISAIVLGAVGIVLSIAILFIFIYFILTVAVENAGGMYF